MKSVTSVLLSDYLKWDLGIELTSIEELRIELENYDFLWDKELTFCYNPSEAAEILYKHKDDVIEITSIHYGFDIENSFKLNDITYTVISTDLPLTVE